MPTTYAHYKFGKEVISTLPRPLETSIENNRALFDIGLHGPDILFYYKALSSNPVSRQGYELHDKMADSFFKNAVGVIEGSGDPSAARAYMYGFICHFALDSECHKYIEKMIQVSGVGHFEIEMEFDRYLLTEEHINPLTYLGTKHIRPTRNNAAIIAPFFDGLSEDTVEKALRSMIFYHKLMMAPTPGRRKLLFGAMKLAGCYSSKHGMVMSREANPECEKYCLLLKKLFAGAAPLAASLIIRYQKVLFQNAELPARFHETFGAGDNWKTLPL